MLFPITIIKCHPSAQRGALRGYTITQRWPDRADVFQVIATSGRQAIQQVRQLQAVAA